VFEFFLTPPLFNINRMNLSLYVSLHCNSTTYEVSSISYSLGTLELVVDYTEDLEGLTC
jgi:hypothetical protein